MRLETSIQINSDTNRVWEVITDIETAKDRLSGIDHLEVLHQPNSGLIGTKWKETRTFHRKQSTEIMWITEAEEGKSYLNQAESHGCVYQSGFSLEGTRSDTRLDFTFSGSPQTLFSKILSFLMTPLFIGSLKKVMEQDLRDIKAYIENKS